MLIVQTTEYTEAEVGQILKARAEIEQVQLTDDALAKLAQTGVRTSLRYAM